MDVGELVSLYMKALNELQPWLKNTEDLVLAHDFCEPHVRIKLPYKPPAFYMFREEVEPSVKKSSQIVADILREHARSIGVSEVSVPYLNRCVSLQYEVVPIEVLGIALRAIKFDDEYQFLIALEIEPNKPPVRRIPLAYVYTVDEMKPYEWYVDYLIVIYMTSIFISRNPWIVDALKKTIEAISNNRRAVMNDLENLYNALKLLGAEYFHSID